jgi:peroxiredoxin
VKSVHAGVVAPDFEATTLDGKLFKLSELRGKVVLLDFWATWCAPCVAELPNVKKASEQFADGGFVAVGISFDRDAETARQFAAKKQMSWPQVWAQKADDGPIADLYGVGGIPATFLIGPNGKVIDCDLRGEKLIEVIDREVRRLKQGQSKTAAATITLDSVQP